MGKRTTGRGSAVYIKKAGETAFTSEDKVTAVIDMGALEKSHEDVDTSDINKKSSIDGSTEYSEITVNMYIEDDSPEENVLTKIEGYFDNKEDIDWAMVSPKNPASSKKGRGRITTFTIAERSADEPMKASFVVKPDADGWSQFTETITE